MPTRTLICIRCGGNFVRTNTPANLNRAKYCSPGCMAATFRERTPELMDALRQRLAERSAPQANGCILYTGQNNGIYGQIEHRRRTYLAHRSAYMVHTGPIPAGLCICHSCDTPLCINPEHLWLGTERQNAEDRDSKKRGRWTTRRKLTDEQVAAIRGASGTNAAIAKEYGIANSMVSMIRSGLRHAKTSLALSHSPSLSA
jgi:hypothetical protein